MAKKNNKHKNETHKLSATDNKVKHVSNLEVRIHNNIQSFKEQLSSSPTRFQYQSKETDQFTIQKNKDIVQQLYQQHQIQKKQKQLISQLSKGITIKDTDLLKGANLQEKNLQKIVFINCDLRNIIFRLSNLCQTQFINCDLSGADFRKSNLSDTTFDQCVMHGTNFQYTKMSKAHISNSMIYATNFDYSKMDKILINNSKLISVNWNQVCMQSGKLLATEIQKSLISESNWSKMTCEQTYFYETALIDVDMSNGKISNSKFDASNMTFGSINLLGSVWKNSSILYCSWLDLNLEGVKFYDCKIENSYFETINITQAHFSKVLFSHSKLEDCYYDAIPKFNKCHFLSMVFSNSVMDPSLLECDGYDVSEEINFVDCDSSLATDIK